MTEPNEEITLAQAAEIFNTTVAASGFLKQSDPGSINAEVASLKEFCSKLKFQYLEQDSRDKFLRLLFLKDVDSINQVTQADVDKLLESNASAKVELKSLKKELAVLLALNEATADEVIALNRRHEARQAEIETARAELKAMEKEFEGLINDPANESYKMLLDLNKMIDSEDVGPEEAIRIAENVLHEDQATASSLVETEKQLMEEDSRSKTLVAELETRLTRLKSEAGNPARASIISSNFVDPEQTRAQGLRELNALLQKFTMQQVDISPVEQNIAFSFAGSQIIFDRNLNIVSVSNRLLSTLDVNRVNQLSGDAKISRLSWLLAHVLSE